MINYDFLRYPPRGYVNTPSNLTQKLLHPFHGNMRCFGPYFIIRNLFIIISQISQSASIYFLVFSLIASEERK